MSKKQKTDNLYLSPIPNKNHNFEFVAPHSMPECRPMMATKFGNCVMTNWKLKDIGQRVKFLFKGELTLIIYNQALPPVNIVIGDQQSREIPQEKKKLSKRLIVSYCCMAIIISGGIYNLIMNLR